MTTAVKFRDEAMHPRLNATQLAVLKLAADGRRNHEMAEALGLSESAIQRAMVDVMNALGAASRAGAVAAALRRGVIE